jgi:predicted cupin superfamily sugar epimerase
VTADSEIAALVAALDLSPHPEGGLFCETYRSARSTGDRALSTAIYFLVTAASSSRMHRVSSDEIWHFYAGDPLEMLQLAPDGSSRTIAIGNDVASGARPQVLVPANVWQGVRVREGGRYGLVGATVTPGFDFADFEMGDRTALVAAYPGRRALVEALT